MPPSQSGEVDDRVCECMHVFSNRSPPVYFHCDLVSTHAHTYMYSPWRIVEDCGAAFAMGCIGGGVFSSFKGYRNSPVVCTGLLHLIGEGRGVGTESHKQRLVTS